jgi:hypothetical protein
MKLRTSPPPADHLYEELEYGPLTWPKLEQVIFQTFRHSQGQLNTQTQMFKYLKLLHPEWTMPSITEKTREHLTNRLRAFLPKEDAGEAHASKPMPQVHIPVSDRDLEGGQQDVLEKLDRYLKRSPSEAAVDLHETNLGTIRALIFRMRQKLGYADTKAMERKYKDNLLHWILPGILERDRTYLLKTLFGRPRGMAGKASSPMLDPYFSFTCAYLVQDKPTGLPEFDVMYDEMRAYIQASPDREAYLKAIHMLVAKHNEHHPDDLIENPEALLGSNV